MFCNGSGARVVIVSSVPISEPVIRNRVTPFFKRLLGSGYDVCFVCPRSEGNRARLEAGVELHEVSVDFIKPKGFVRRAVREAYNAFKVVSYAKDIKADAWLITIPSMFLAFIAPYVLTGRKVFLDVRDLTWEYLSDKSLLQRFSKRFFRVSFARSLSFFNLVCATNPTEVEYIKGIWKGKRPPLLVTNGIAREQYEKLKQVESAARGTTTVSYIGNIGFAQRLDTLVEAADQLPDIEFRIVGSGIDFDRIEKLISEKKLKNVVLTGRVGWDAVREYYGRTDILYAQLTPDYAGAMPSKLYEYLATGKPIIYGGCGQAVETLSMFDNNQVVNPCDVAALVKVIKTYGRSRGNIKLSHSNREKINSEYIREDAAKTLVDSINFELYAASTAC